jgi:hypothetical protein
MVLPLTMPKLIQTQMPAPCREQASRIVSVREFAQAAKGLGATQAEVIELITKITTRKALTMDELWKTLMTAPCREQASRIVSVREFAQAAKGLGATQSEVIELITKITTRIIHEFFATQEPVQPVLPVKPAALIIAQRIAQLKSARGG